MLHYICENILSWKSRKGGEIFQWPGFHQDAENSNYRIFRPRRRKITIKTDFLEILHHTIAKNIPIYRYLKTRAFKAWGKRAGGWTNKRKSYEIWKKEGRVISTSSYRVSFLIFNFLNKEEIEMLKFNSVSRFLY